jgi:cytoskeletal protein RodZ
VKIKPVTIALVLVASVIVAALWVLAVIEVRKQRPTTQTIPKARPTPEAPSPIPTPTPEEAEAEAYEIAKQEAARMFADRKARSSALALYIDSMTPAEYNDGDTLDITVTQHWHVQHYQLRLQAAQNLDAEWKRYHKKEGLARIRILDFNGNEVGATGVLGVWVQE